MKKAIQKFAASKTGKVVIGAAAVAPVGAFAEGEPLDLSTAGSTIAGYAQTAGGAAVTIFITVMGIKWMVRAFKAVS